MKIELKGRGLNGVVIGEALVLDESFTFFGGVEWATGNLLVGNEDTLGRSIKNKVFIFKAPSGGQGHAWKIGEMKHLGSAPGAIVVHKSNNVLVSGCIMAGITMVADTDDDPTTAFRSGDTVEVDGISGRVRLLQRKN